MSDTIENMQRKIATAAELQSVVRTMKALAAAGIGQYQQAVRSLQDYYRSIEQGLAAYVAAAGGLRRAAGTARAAMKGRCPASAVIVFGSDQGLVGQFNVSLVGYCNKTLDTAGTQHIILAVGERIFSEWQSSGVQAIRRYELPVSIVGITPLVQRLLIEIEGERAKGGVNDVLVFHNRPAGQTGYEPVMQRLLPLTQAWEEEISHLHWPGRQRPEVIGRNAGIALIREYLFVSLYKACAESLAAENASRLAAMQHADKNIETISGQLINAYHRLRQQEIDEELFDIIFGSEALEAAVRCPGGDHLP